MIKNILIFGLLIMMMQACGADQVLSIILTVQKNDTASVEYLKVVEGKPSFHVAPGGYYLKITDDGGRELYGESFDIQFIDEGNAENINESLISLRIPYREGMSKLLLYNESKLILSYNINNCNRDSICGSEETYLTCPVDCPLDKEDKLCLAKADGICDPDCLSGADPDCSSQPSENFSGVQEKSPITKPDDPMTYLLFGGVILLVILLFFAYRTKKNEDIKKQREDFIRWKDEQEKVKNAGKPSA
jgi:hypothetical protein